MRGESFAVPKGRWLALIGAAILAVGAIQDTPVARSGQVVIRPMLNLTLTCDHRVLDGATAAEFLGTVKAYLEEPGLAL